MKRLFQALFLFLAAASFAGAQDAGRQINEQTEKIMPKVIEWRRFLHQYPELSNREVKTAKYVENHLRSLGLEIRTGIAKTGVVAILKGSQPGPVIGLRADMDGLPVTERVDIP